MSTWPLLTLITFIPLVGMFLLFFIRGTAEEVARNARDVTLIVTFINFVLSLKVLLQFDSNNSGFQLVEKYPLIPSLGINYHMGVDGISLALILLTTFLMPLTILLSKHVAGRVREYMALFLLLETMMIGTFCALDAMLFYVFFEAVLIPMFLIIGIWGGPRRVYAAFKFFLYTLLGSVLMLVALIAIYLKTGTTDIPTLLETANFPFETQKWLWLAFLASFAVKLPMWPVHTWLPDAHVEAPTAGSVILAGVLLKMGGYGLLRFSLPMLPDASVYFAPLMWTLGVAAIIYTSLVALVQDDMKKLIAYSSVAHMGFVTLGLFSFTLQGMQGAMFQMISHGVVSAALFMCVGVLYDRMHTRQIAAYGGVVNLMPKFAVLFMLMTLASVGLPGTSGFVGEFLSLLGIFQTAAAIPADSLCNETFRFGPTVALLATTGVVLGAAYMLWLYRRVMYGEVANHEVGQLKDVDVVEWSVLALIGLIVLWLGIDSNTLLQFLEPSLQQHLGYVDLSAVCPGDLPPAP
jgi:NADH-quinone oxidoreductase subunit M